MHFQNLMKVYVSELTIDMGEKGKKGLKLLFEHAHKKGFLSQVQDFGLV